MIKKLLLILLLVNLTVNCFGYTWTERYANCGLGTGLNDGTSEANAWQDLQTAFDNVAAGERINIIDSTECDITARIDVDTTPGTSDLPIALEGYTSSAGDGGIAVIDCQSNAIDGLFVSEPYQIFKNIEIKNCGDDGIDIQSTGDHSHLYQVYIDNAGSNGVEIDGIGDQCWIIGSEIGSAGDNGIDAVGRTRIFYSYIHNISDIGVQFVDSENLLINTIVNTTGEHNLVVGARTSVVNNTLYNATESGFDNIQINADNSYLINNLLNVANDDQIEVGTGHTLWQNIHSNMYDGGAGTKSGDIIYTEGESLTNPDLNTTTFNLGSSTTIDDAGYPTYFDAPSGGTTVVNHAEMGAIPYEETATGGGEFSFGSAQ